MGCVYVATNRVNGKQYVGKTTRTLAARRRDHLKGGIGHCRALHAALEKYGPAAFMWTTVRDGIEGIDRLNRAECETVALLKTKSPHGYNLTPGGDGFDWSDPEFRARHRAAVARACKTPGHRAKLSAAIKRLYCDPAHIEKMRVAISRRNASPEWRENHRAGIERRAADAKWRASCVEARKRRNADPGWRKHHAEAMSRTFGKPILCVETREKYPTAREAWRRTGVSPSSLCQHLRGRSMSAGGLHWRYLT